MTLETELDQHQLDEIEKKYDSSINTRANGPALTRFIYWATIAFALYHLWTAGFGTPVDYVHMGIHLAGLFLFIFLYFPVKRTPASLSYEGAGLLKPGNVPLYDWAIALAGMLAALFLWISWRGLEIFGLDIPIRGLIGRDLAPSVDRLEHM